MRYALIGCGRIAGRHLTAARAASLEVVAVCDPVLERGRELLRRTGLGESGARIYADHRELLDRERPELAAVAAESGVHARVALDCLDAGAHVIVEKPIALSLSDADEMIRRAGERGLCLVPCHQNRFNPAVMALRRALDAGRFGRLSHAALTLRWNRDDAYYRQADWRGRWASDGGILMNQCIHGIDLLRWMGEGEPEWVCGALARRMHPRIETEDVGIAAVRFSGGMLATIEGSGNLYPSNLEETLSVFGERGTARLGGAAANRIEVWRVEGEETPPRIEPAPGGGQDIYGSGHLALYADASAAIREGRRPFITGEDGRAALELVLAVYRSHRTGGPVTLPLAGFSSAEMEGIFP